MIDGIDSNSTEESIDDKLSREAGKSVKHALVRGALKTEITTSTDLVSAGKEFSIYVVIYNPFDIPITLHRTETHIPIELTDEITRSRLRKELLFKREDEINTISSFWKRTWKQFVFKLKDIRFYDKLASGERVAEAVGVEYERFERKEIERSVNFNTDADSSITVGNNVVAGDLWDLDFAQMTSVEIRQILWDINQYMKGKSPVILQPGNSVVRHFVLKTTSWLTFKPLAHTFQIQIAYDVGGEYQTDTIPFSVNIQASMMSSIIGAIIGSFLGAFVKTPPDITDVVGIGRTMLTSAIFATIIVVAFARKSNVQQIISVEDFWGGVFIGFLTGYSGESFINSILGAS